MLSCLRYANGLWCLWEAVANRDLIELFSPDDPYKIHFHLLMMGDGGQRFKIKDLLYKINPLQILRLGKTDLGPWNIDL